jgi:hypothetical protein
LGRQYDPFFALCNPTFDRKPRFANYDPVRPIGEPLMPSLGALPEMTVDRLDGRRTLLAQLDAGFRQWNASTASRTMDKFGQQAFSMLTTSKTRDAFDLSKETDATRDRYGRNLSGSSLLVARRLVEAGVRFVSVHAEIFGANGHSYDMHENNFNMLKDENLPILDMAFPSLLQDLEDRGLLDSTLVIVMGEMGRSPKVNAKAGRDHWPQCGFSLMAGGGVKSGMVYGATDKHAAYPTRDPVSPGDVVATIYQLLGIDPQTTVPDLSGRPTPMAASRFGTLLRSRTTRRRVPLRPRRRFVEQLQQELVRGQFTHAVGVSIAVQVPACLNIQSDQRQLAGRDGGRLTRGHDQHLAHGDFAGRRLSRQHGHRVELGHGRRAKSPATYDLIRIL